MPGGIDGFGIAVVTTRAGIDVLTRLRAGGLLDCSALIIMPEGIDFLIRRIIAARAGLVSLPTDFGTGRFLPFVRNVRMSESTDSFRIAIAAYRASKL